MTSFLRAGTLMLTLMDLELNAGDAEGQGTCHTHAQMMRRRSPAASVPALIMGTEIVRTVSLLILAAQSVHQLMQQLYHTGSLPAQEMKAFLANLLAPPEHDIIFTPHLLCALSQRV